MSCIDTLQRRGLRMTRQRRLILDVLHDSGTHLTGEDIIGIVQDKMSRVNKSTIYRTLGLLERLGCVYKSESGGKSTYHHAEEGRHHHIECHACGRTADCDEDIFQPIGVALEERYGFQVSLRHVVMVGLCRDCRRDLKTRAAGGNQ